MSGQKANQSLDEYANGPRILLHTSMGDVTIQLRNDMPITTDNFKNLVQSGTYNGTIFHRVIDGFMIQGGDPTGTGCGDQSIPDIKDEFTRKNRNDRGTIAMANAGPDTGSSQFFINVSDNDFLDYREPTAQGYGYCVFGKVIDGMDTVKAIEKVKTSTQGMHQDVPVADIVIENAHIVEPEETGDKEDKG